MSDLYPTPTRLRLLGEIANYQVMTDTTRDDDQDVILLFPDAPTSWQDSVRVTARVREMEAAGWVEENVVGDWQPTGTGYEVLARSQGGDPR